MYKISLAPLEDFTAVLGYVSGGGHCSFHLGLRNKRTVLLKKKKKVLTQGHTMSPE